MADYKWPPNTARSPATVLQDSWSLHSPSSASKEGFGGAALVHLMGQVCSTTHSSLSLHLVREQRPRAAQCLECTCSEQRRGAGLPCLRKPVICLSKFWGLTLSLVGKPSPDFNLLATLFSLFTRENDLIKIVPAGLQCSFCDL